MPEASPKLIRVIERVLVLEPGRANRHYWRDLWEYRELFAILGWRDVSVQYKQTAIGAAWAVIRPLLTMMIFTIVFGHMARLPSEGGVPYPLMVMAGMLPWFLFSTILANGSQSLVQNNSLLSKVYFPRLIVPVSSSLVAIVDFLISLTLLVALMLYYGIWPAWRVLLLPGFVGLAAISALGPALMMASLNVKYRDFRFIVPFVVQFGLYISPVGFSSRVIPQKWQLLYSLNPVVGVVDGFRWCLLGTGTSLFGPGFMISVGVALFLFFAGLKTFRSSEQTFADLV